MIADRYQAWIASPTCRAAAMALMLPIRKLKFVPRYVAREPRGRKEGRQVEGQRKELKVRKSPYGTKTMDRG